MTTPETATALKITSEKIGASIINQALAQPSSIETVYYRYLINLLDKKLLDKPDNLHPYESGLPD